MKEQGLCKTQRLCSPARIAEIFDKGQSGKSRHVIARLLPNELDFTRAAAVAGRKAGKAVARNRLKRRLRAAFRTVRVQLPVGFDVVLLARKSTLDADFTELVDGVRKSVARAIEEISRSESGAEQ